MLLKLKLKHDDLYDIWEPTNIFHIDSFLDSRESSDILLLAQQFVNSKRYTDGNPLKTLVVNTNELHFDVTKTDAGYSLTPTKKAQFSVENVENIVCGFVGLTKEQLFRKGKDGDLIRPRSVVYAALRYFGGMSYSKIGMLYLKDHASIMHGIKKTLPSLLFSGDITVISLLDLLVAEYSDNKFISFCREFDRIELKPKPKSISVYKYRGIYPKHNKSGVVWKAQVGHRYKTISLGTFKDRSEAEEVLRNYKLQLGE